MNSRKRASWQASPINVSDDCIDRRNTLLLLAEHGIKGLSVEDALAPAFELLAGCSVQSCAACLVEHAEASKRVRVDCCFAVPIFRSSDRL